MQYTARLADADTASRYPLPVHDEARWESAGDASWRLTLALPAVPAGHIIVPSLALLGDADAGYETELQAQARYPLQGVPADAKPAALPADAVEASSHIDCWHSEADLPTARVVFRVSTSMAPATCLAVVSVRPVHLAQTPSFPAASADLELPVTLSQYEAADDIKHRICSPTALCMALSAYPNPPAWDDTIAACYDPATRAYGVWPLAVRWAARRGVVAAVETFVDWQDAAVCLEAGVPLVCSIDFKTGKLEGAPMAQTGGHLVVLHGMNGSEVLVKDPGGADRSAVERLYDGPQFSDAWLTRRGAAYVFALPRRSA